MVTNLKEAHNTKGGNISTSIEKSVTLAIIDDIWKEHLREMDDLKQSVQNAVYEQKDPLLIYKFESFAYDIFEHVMKNISYTKRKTYFIITLCNIFSYNAFKSALSLWHYKRQT